MNTQDLAVKPNESAIPAHFKLLDHSSVRVVLPFTLDGVSYPDARERLSQAKAQNGDQAWVPMIFDGKIIEHVDDFVNVSKDTQREIAVALRFAQIFSLDYGDLYFTVKKREVGFRLVTAELVLFQSGIGFCTVELQPTSEGSVSDLADIAHYLRFTWSSSGSRRAVSDIRRRSDPAGGSGSRDVLVIFETFLSPLRDMWEPAGVEGQLRAYTIALIHSEVATPTEMAELTHRFRRLFHSQAVVSVGTGRDLYPAGLSYGENMTLHHSLDGGGFVGIKVPNDAFHRQTLPDHMRRVYYFGFILALHQRLLAERFSLRVQEIDSLSTAPANVKAELHHANEVSRELRHSLTRFFFRQTMQTQNHHTSYRRWLEVFEVDSFVAEVRQELIDTYTYLEAMQRENNDVLAQERSQRFERIGVAFACLSIVTGMLGININGVNVSADGFSLRTILLFVVLPALLLVALVANRLANQRARVLGPLRNRLFPTGLKDQDLPVITEQFVYGRSKP
jgi:hypothetical protein